MVFFRRFRRRLRTLVHRRTTEAEMAEEMRFHLEQRAADYATDGLPADEARLAAQRKFGNTAALQESARDTFGWGALERFWRDLVFAARQLIRAPGFSFLAIVTLGLGIGANTAMFSVLNTIVFKPLPYAHRDSLDRIWRTTPQNPQDNHSAPDYLALRREEAAYGEFTGYTVADAILSAPGQPAEHATLARCAPNFFSLLGVSLQLGHDFQSGDDTPGRDRVVILSQRVWQNRYGARADIIGQLVRVDGVPHEVIGVLPASFNDWRYLGSIDFFQPLALSPAQAADREAHPIRILGRRTPTLTPEAAARFVAEFGARLAHDFPDENRDSSWRAVPLPSVAAGIIGRAIPAMLVALSAAVLLIACANLANLLLARTMSRAREFAVRGALGASRLQLLRPLVAESLLLSLAGAVLAILVAIWFRDWAALRSTAANGEQVVFALDWSVLAWAFLAALFTATAFGLAPALFALRLDLNQTLKSGGRGSSGGRSSQRFRHALIVAQFALAMILLSCAGLFIHGLDQLHHRRSGWESAPLLTGTVALPAATSGDAAQLTAFQRRVLDRLAALPGVRHASLSTATPFYNWTEVHKLVIDGQQRPPVGREPAAVLNRISPDYLATYGTRLVAGRNFTAQDDAGAPPVFLISQATARAFFGDANPLGRRLAFTGTDVPAWGEIVGVVADFQTLDAGRNPVPHHLYQPLAQAPAPQCLLALHADRLAPGLLVDSVRSALAELDPDIPLQDLQPADQFLARSAARLLALRDTLGAFGALGLALASLGVFGVIARAMAQRHGEFAIRLALGASNRDITRLVLGAGLRQALLGAALGLLGTFGVTAILNATFPGLQTRPLPILGATTAILIAVALLACWLPARRAGRIDAMQALRAD